MSKVYNPLGAILPHDEEKTKLAIGNLKGAPTEGFRFFALDAYDVITGIRNESLPFHSALEGLGALRKAYVECENALMAYDEVNSDPQELQNALRMIVAYAFLIGKECIPF